MKVDLIQGGFSHGVCLNCKHFGRIETFNPTVVNLEDSNNPQFTFKITSGPKDLVQTINYNCPICNSASVDTSEQTELN